MAAFLNGHHFYPTGSIMPAVLVTETAVTQNSPFLP